ncbi:hemoglobin/transferrin/lactoferrin receptor protein [Halopseudomonas salegens]|uniref:Hemoglobin/transferrin/lactoferrin receptor protein n=2 Tax=Halopseudomonas salegens TaxID=1434072 RepID=A0A1H2DVW8_9GAMM|nr:hemoglobin/transferrin/lactoferrin receptor protein [Halopseudomonas salegens]
MRIVFNQSRLWPLLALPLSLPALAELPAKGAARQFDTLTVTATRQEERVGDVAGSVSVTDEQQIDRENINNIQDLVRFEPGVSVSGTGSRFGLSGFSIRGIGGNRILTQVDGIGVPDAFDFGGFLSARRNYVDLDTVKRVEIIRGPASSLYGSDAIGGAVSFLTKDAGDYLGTGDDSYGRLKTGYASADRSWLRSATLAGRHGQWDALLHLGRRSGDETASFGGNGGTGSQREKANPINFTTDNLLSKLGWDYSERGRLQLTWETFHDDTDTRVLSDYSDTATIRRSDARDLVERERISLQHNLTLDRGFADRLSWQLSHQDSQSRQQTFQNRVVGGQPTYRSRDSIYEEKLWAFNIQLERDFDWGKSNHRLVYGADIKRLQSADLRQGQETILATGISTPIAPTSDFPDPTVKEYALFAQDTISLGRWTIIPGLRYDRYEMHPKATQEYLNSAATNPNPPTYRDSALSPKLGIVFALDDAHQLYAQYAAGFRAPQPVSIFGEFENPGRYRSIANPDLKAETSDSYELGLRGEYAQGSFGLAAYHNRYDDFIEQQNRPSSAPGFPFGEFQNINLDKVTIYGAEARGELYLDHIGLPLGSRSRASLAWARGKDDTSGQPLNSIDPLKAVIALGYDQPNGRYGTELILTAVAAKSRIDASQAGGDSFRTHGYGILDLTGYWQMTDSMVINAGVFNLTDRQYWHWSDVSGQPAGTPGLARFSQPGRHAAVNLAWEF